MNISPLTVARARSARMVREATTPVYTTATPTVREHLAMVEMEYVHGGRSWSKPMPAGEVSAYVDSFPEDSYYLSDIDCSVKCWCVKEGRYGQI